MSQHIGIVACSAEGAALCYRTICVEGAKLFERLRICERFAIAYHATVYDITHGELDNLVRLRARYIRYRQDLRGHVRRGCVVPDPLADSMSQVAVESESWAEVWPAASLSFLRESAI